MITLFISIQKEFVRDFGPGGWGRGRGGRERGTLDFKWRGWSKDVLGFEDHDSGICLGRRIWRVFFGWIDLRGIFWAIQNNLKNRGRVVLRKLKPNLASGVRHGIFGGLIFGPGIFVGFDLCPRHSKSVVPRGDFGASKRRTELGGCSNYTWSEK